MFPSLMMMLCVVGLDAVGMWGDGALLPVAPMRRRSVTSCMGDSLRGMAGGLRHVRRRECLEIPCDLVGRRRR